MVKESKIDQEKARYSRKKNDKFVVSQQRTASELKRCQHPPWPHLPPDLLAEIMVKLSSADQVRFRNVCKSFLLPNHEDRVVDELPWLVSSGWRTNPPPIACVCKLFDPYDDKPYSIDEIVSEEIFGSNLLDDAYSCVCASEHGWLLISWENKHTDLTSFFLFSPFTKQIITLPDLDLSSSFGDVELELETRILIATYSADPNSPGCVFFVLGNYCHSYITINTCKRSDTKWKTLLFHSEGGPIADVIYSRGCFYCVSMSGSLAVCTVDYLERIHINIIQMPARSTLVRRRSYSGERLHLLESNGEILLAILTPKLRNTRENDGFRILKFNGLTWDNKTSLENRALFLGCSSFAVSASHAATTNIANKVYYRASKDKLRFYSLEDGESHECEAFSPPSAFSGWPAPGSWAGTIIWIQPPPFPTNTDSI